MANKVEIIIQAVDKFTANAKKININLRDMARAGAAVAGGFALAYKALDSFGALAAKLHFDKTAEQVNYMKRSLEDTEAALLQFNVGGMQIQAWLGQAAEGMGSLVRLIGVGLAGALYLANIGLINMHRTLAKLLPSIVEYSNEQMVADLTTAEFAFKTNVANIATDGYAKSLERTTRKLKAATRAQKDLSAEWQKAWAISEAIRAGDPRALMSARGGAANSRMTAPGAGAGGSMNKGDTVVNVIVDGEIIRSQTRKTLAEDVFKPVLKSGSGKRR